LLKLHSVRLIHPADCQKHRYSIMQQGFIRARKYCAGCGAERSMYGENHYHVHLMSGSNHFWVEACSPVCIPRALALGDELYTHTKQRQDLIEQSYKERYGEEIEVPDGATIWEISDEPPLT